MLFDPSIIVVKRLFHRLKVLYPLSEFQRVDHIPSHSPGVYSSSCIDKSRILRDIIYLEIEVKL